MPPASWQSCFRKPISAVIDKTHTLKDLLDQILEHHDKHNEISVRCADSVEARMDNFKFCSLLCFLWHFLVFRRFFAILQNKTWGTCSCLAKLNEFCYTVDKKKGTDAASGVLGPQESQGQVGLFMNIPYQLHLNILDICFEIHCHCATVMSYEDHHHSMFLTFLISSHLWHFFLFNTDGPTLFDFHFN